MSKQKKRWVKPDIQFAIDEWNKGKSATEIASMPEMKGKTRNSVLGVLYRRYDAKDERITRPMRRARGKHKLWRETELFLLLRLSEPLPEDASDPDTDSDIAKRFNTTVEDVIETRAGVLWSMKKHIGDSEGTKPVGPKPEPRF